MTIYAQHGYGKSDKIEAGIRGKTLSGVVLSPRDETPARMESYVADLRGEFGADLQILLDPQFYATTVLPARDGKLPDYPYYRGGLTRGNFVSPSNIALYVRETLDYQRTLGVSRLVSPTVLFDDFNDPWSQIALGMASEAQGALTPSDPGLLLSLVFDEGALRHRKPLDDFLDLITMWDVPGFYVVVRRADVGYPAHSDETVLTNLMYLLYALGEINSFEVVTGYSDFVGLLGQAVGATATCTGWYNSLRQFSLRRFQPVSGGRAARPRYSSGPLLNSVLILPEFSSAWRLGHTASVHSGTAHDAALGSGNPGTPPWPAAVSCLHHWEVMSRLASTVVTAGRTSRRLDALEAILNNAIASYASLEAAGVTFGTHTGSREAHAMSRAVAAFRREVGV